MIINVVRSMSAFQIKYCVDCLKQIDAKANCTYTILPQSLKVSDNRETELMLKQNNFLLRLFDALPVINLFRFTPYTFISNNVACGKLTKAQIMPAYTLVAGDDTYEIRLHNHDICTLTKNGTVVAKYRKEKESFMEKTATSLNLERATKNNCVFMF